MPTNPIFDVVRQHLQQGETGAALQTIITYLEADGKQADLLHTLRVIQANFNSAKQQELKGILAFQEAQREYSKVNDAILTVVEDLNAGRSSSTVPPTSTRRNFMPWILGGVALIVLALVAVFMMKRAEKTETAQTQPATTHCPDFRANNYHVMLLPFVPLSDANSKPERGLQQRIRDLTSKNGMMADVEIATDLELASLPDFARAAEKGESCKADMVVWGQYDKVGDSILVDVHYVFSSEPKWGGRTTFQPFRSIAALQNSGNASGLRSLDDAILSLCSIMAVHAGRPEMAEKWLSKIKKSTGNDNKLSEVINDARSNLKKEETPTPIERLKDRRNKNK